MRELEFVVKCADTKTAISSTRGSALMRDSITDEFKYWSKISVKHQANHSCGTPKKKTPAEKIELDFISNQNEFKEGTSRTDGNAWIFVKMVASDENIGT